MTIYERKWQAGLAALNPSKKDLEHGLELHKNSFVFDCGVENRDEVRGYHKGTSLSETPLSQLIEIPDKNISIPEKSNER